MPLLPQIPFWWGKLFYEPPTYAAVDEAPAANADIPKTNTLIVPSMQLEKTIHEGPDARTLRQGVWHRPHTSTPDRGGNTVLVAHRFTYNGPATFYHLDKVQRGDTITVYWGGAKYTYRVTTIKIVRPSDIAVESNTADNRLTLYTCTPLWSAKDRLVITASLIGGGI